MILSLPLQQALVSILLFDTLANCYPGSPEASHEPEYTHENGKREQRDRIWENQIRCIGLVPTYLKKATDPFGQEVTYDTVRNICAKSWYGGRANANLGGYCKERPGMPRMVYFERGAELDFKFGLPPTYHDMISNIHASFQFERVPNIRAAVQAAIQVATTASHAEMEIAAQTLCQLRCRCISPGEPSDRLNWPASEVLDGDNNLVTSYDKNLPVEELSNVRNFIRQQSPTSTGQDFIFSYWYPEDGHWSPLLSPFPPEEHVGDDQVVVRTLQSHGTWFRPVCIDNLPKYYPYPFMRDDFASARALCAANFFGGSESGNAGFVCKKTSDREPRELTQFDHLSHPAFLPDNDGPGMSIYLWCFSVCRCNVGESRTQDPVPLGNARTASDVIASFRDGEIHLSRPGNAPLPPGVPEMLGPESCDGFSIVECETALAGLIPRKSDPFGPISLADGSPTSKQCGNRCSGPQQCGEHCVCVAKQAWIESFQQTSRNSLRFAPAYCVSAAMIYGRESSRKRLGGRALGERDQAQMIQCPCNSTFVSNDCCEWKKGTQLHNISLS